MVLISYPLLAQKKSVKEGEVPEAVKKNFTAKYPDAKTRTWKTKNGNYEVDFYIDMKKYEAKYEGSGEWKKTGMEISKKELPEVVSNAWKSSEFGSWFLDNTEQVETPDHKVLYQLKLTKNGNEMELLYTPSGELMKAKNKSGKS